MEVKINCRKPKDFEPYKKNMNYQIFNKHHNLLVSDSNERKFDIKKNRGSKKR